ncbi:MAG: tetratricopeptide repeat protein, partial [Thermoguttaceae bacterium]|nr:tetratricopeptide repeat protein [Thermoguttaceae bacterium]
MAGKRLNIKFVIILTTILVVLGFGAFLMLRIQSSRQVETCYQIGLDAFERGDMEEARSNLGHVVDKLKDDEDRANAMRKLVLSYISILDQSNKSHNDVEICQSWAERALQMDASELGEDRAKIKEALARCQEMLGRTSKAAQTYVELSNEFPDNPDFLLHAAECYTRSKDAKAVDVLSKLVSFHKDFIPGWIAFARYYQEANQYDLALQQLNTMVAETETAQA